MKKILFIIIFCSLFSGSAFAAKRVCIFVHKNYMEVKEPVLLAKRRMIVDLVGCEEGNNDLDDPWFYLQDPAESVMSMGVANMVLEARALERT